MIERPLYQNPLAGGAMIRPQDEQLQGDALVEQMQMRMQQRDQKTPAFMAYFGDVMDTKGYPTKTMQEYESQFPEYIPQQVPLGVNMFNATPPSVPVSEQTPMSGLSQVFSPEELVETGQFLPNSLRNPVRPKSDDPIRQGFFDSEFYKPNAPTTLDVVNYTYQGKPMTGSSSNISQFQQYLDSIGKGDLIQRNDQIFSQETGPLATVSGPSDNLNSYMVNPPLLDGTKGFPVTVSGPETIASVNPFEEQFTGFQNQLTGFGDQFSILGDRLTKVEEGIASLLNKNTGSSFNSMQPTFGYARYGYSPFSMVGLGSLFGGYYG